MSFRDRRQISAILSSVLLATNPGEYIHYPYYHVSSNHFHRTHYLGRALPGGSIWRAEGYSPIFRHFLSLKAIDSEIVMKSIVERANDVLLTHKDREKSIPDPSFGLRLPDDVEPSSNLFVIQKVFQGSFQFDVFFESGDLSGKLNCMIFTTIECRETEMCNLATTLDYGIPALVAAYNAKFKAKLPITFAYAPSKMQSLEDFSKAITSNLLGGIGYFYGPSIISDKSPYEWDSNVGIDDLDPPLDVGSSRLTDSRSLLTATPSRSFFPRGFYW